MQTKNWTSAVVSGGFSSFLCMVVGVGSLIAAGFYSPLLEPSKTNSYEGFLTIGYFFVLLAFFKALSSAEDYNPRNPPIKSCVFGFLQMAVGVILVLSVFPTDSVESFLFWAAIIAGMFAAGINNAWTVLKYILHEVPAAFRQRKLEKATAKTMRQEVKEREEKEKIEKDLISDLANFLSDTK